MKRSISLSSLIVVVSILFSCEKKDSLLENKSLESFKTSDTETFSTCETAFARKTALSHAFCFTELDLDSDGKPDFNRWGWSNGPITEGTSTWYNIYAAAGQCDPDKGVLVGRMDVHYYDGTISIVMSTLAPYTFDETHLYVGSSIVPVNSNNGRYTVAPGQFPYSHDLSSARADYYTINDVTGSVYIIMHAVVCGM